MNEISNEIDRAKLKKIWFWLRISGGFCGVFALIQIFAMNGWILNFLPLQLSAAGTLAVFIVREIFRAKYFVPETLPKYLKKFWLEALLLIAIPLTIFFQIYSGAFGDIEDSRRFLSAQNFLIFTILLMRGMRRKNAISAGKSLSPGMIFILSFAILIFLGTILLLTPRATSGGISFVDALFLSTSAVCVTGLVPVASISETLTPFGQGILLILAQLGGLGVMSITYFFAYFFAGGLSIRNRFAAQDFFSENNLSQIGVVLALIVGFTFAVESVGALWIYFSYAAGTENSPIFFSIFHSVMAFCNAGFSTFSGETPLPSCRNFLSAIALLSLIGRLGFPVVKIFWFVVNYSLRRIFIRGFKGVPVKLSVHSKLVLLTTGILIFCGFIALSGTALNEETSLERTLFFAVSSRTSGFDFGNTANLGSGTLLVMMFLMFIGGAPFSTAGGIKVTTLAVSFLALKQFIYGKKDLELFNRRLDSDVANNALAIVLLGVGFFFLIAIALCSIEADLPARDLIFEAISACATVGLSCEITPQLSAISKFILAAAMFIGRIGVLLFAASFITRKPQSNARFPEATITLS